MDQMIEEALYIFLIRIIRFDVIKKGLEFRFVGLIGLFTVDIGPLLQIIEKLSSDGDRLFKCAFRSFFFYGLGNLIKCFSALWNGRITVNVTVALDPLAILGIKVDEPSFGQVTRSIIIYTYFGGKFFLSVIEALLATSGQNARRISRKMPLKRRQ